MNFLVDEKLPPILAEWLRDKDLEAVHVRELGLASADDRDVLTEAIARGAVLISKDSDFSQGSDMPIIWVRMGNTTNAVRVATFERLWNEIETALTNGDRLVEIVD